MKNALKTIETFELPSAPAWSRGAREGAWSRFVEKGFPTTKDEAWRYANLGFLNESVSRPQPVTPEVEARVKSLIASIDLDAYQLVFINGQFMESLSDSLDMPAGVIMTSLIKRLDHADPEFSRYVTADAIEHPFVALNQAHFQDGACVQVKGGIFLPKPVQVIFVSAPTDREERLLIQPRNVIALESAARLTLIERHLALDGGRYWENSFTEIFLEDGAHMEYIRVEEPSSEAMAVATTRVEVSPDGYFSSTYFNQGGKFVRNNLNVLLESQSEAVLNGLYLVGVGHQIENDVRVDHLGPRAVSHQLYKGVVTGNGQATFGGKIYVHRDAQKTDAHQTNKNLILSDEAVVNTKPHLEIFADDVKCTHGAAVGQLDEDALFYFKSRGIGEAEARKMLLQGFVGEVAESVPFEPLRHELSERLHTILDEKGSFLK